MIPTRQRLRFTGPFEDLPMPSGWRHANRAWPRALRTRNFAMFD